MDRLAQYQRAAEDCRKMAEGAQVPKHKERWLRIAEMWSGLANDAQRDPGRYSPLVSEQPSPNSQKQGFLVSGLLSKLSDVEKKEMSVAK